MMKLILFASIISGGLFAHPSISLSTPSIYEPGEQTKVRVDVSYIDEVYLRLYRIEDPIDFFSRQSSIHSPRPQAKAKPANFFHMLGGIYDRSRRNTRYLSREMMSEDSRIAMRDFFSLPGLEKDTDTRTPEHLGPSSIPRLKDYPLIREWSLKFEKKKEDDYYSYSSRHHYKTIDVELTEPGVYLVEAYYGTRVAYTPVIVTNMGIITKQDPEKVYVFAADLDDGEPRRLARVMVLSDTNKVAGGWTNLRGFYATSFDTTRLRVLVQDGDDFAIMDRYYYYYEDEDAASGGAAKVYLHTERALYRPDQTVYFKGIARRLKKGLYRNPRPEDVEVVVTDPEGNEVYRSVLTADDWGAFSDSLIVPGSARLGRYTLSATLDGTYHSVQFRVEEYRKPEFKVEVEVDKSAYVQGDEVEITVSADYFFGAPVSEGEVTLKVYRQEYRYYWYYYSEYVDELAGKTDDEGKVKFSYRTPENGESYRYVFEADVRDESRRMESGEAGAFVAEAGVLVRVKPARYVVGPGEELEIKLETTDIFRDPASSRVEVEVHRRYWIHNDRKDEVVATRTLSTDRTGSAIYAYEPKDEGSYYVVARASDERGNQSRDERYFWVSGRGGYYSWDSGDLQIVFDKDSYEPGEYAEALVISPYEGIHLVACVEADRLYKVKSINLKGNTALIRFKVKDQYIPNAYLSVCGFYDGDFFRETAEMKVSRSDELLTVEVKPDKERYEPGEEGRFEIEVTDVKGRPVKADVSVAVVDEALHALAPDIAPSVENFFWGERSNQVSTSSSIYFSFWGYERDYYRLSEAAKDSVVLAAYKGREEPKIREKFKDMAYWNAFVRTNSDGYAEVSFTYPDNLTTWRATCRALSMDTKAGEGRSKSLVTKDLLVRIAPPRFVTERDSLVIPTIVHNYTRSPQKVDLSFEVTGIEILDNRDHTATIRPGGTFRIDWPVVCTGPGDVTLTAKAVGDEYSDAMKLTIPANPYGIRRNLVVASFMPRDDEQVKKKFELPPEAQMRTISAELTVTPTLGSALFAGLSYLAGYPYGCTEQTMSSFFPDLIVAEIIQDPAKGDSALAAELPKMITKGLAKLYGYQHADGGWGWWTHDESMNFMTAYVVHGLTYATELGYEVNQTAIKRGARALESYLRERELNVTERSYMTYVLSMVTADTAKDRKKLITDQLARCEEEGGDAYTTALVALTYHSIGADAKARAAIARLKTQAMKDGGMVSWTGRTRAVEYWWDDAVEVTATALRAFLAIAPDDDMVPKIVYWLLRERRGNHWKSTKDSALALMALAEFLKGTSDAAPDMELTLLLNGSSIASYSIDSDNLSSFSRPLAVDVRGIKVGENELTLSKKGKGNLFASMVVTFFSKEEDIPAGGNELRVSRQYYRLIPRVSRYGELEYEKVELSGPVQVGDPIFVKLTVDADDDYEYVMLTDPLPAGFEVAKHRDRYRIRDERYWWGYYDYEDWGYMYSGREIHDDHVAFFMSYLWNRREMSYVIMPEVPGRFQIMPAEVSLMYYPDKRGHSANQEITVVEMEQR
ncbi:hypothetical protein GF359_00635 [candidate division WOR-3 bacterium]|uniref:Alpha-2-macroglobulin n=1 Tax=candidate division WOR-3 bacterium TaxID=2052148 RepID=A0A9D5K7T5_UNCW3|nr:hypothetical protein [candidate division WOR-3 bacterium]MBD3363699.1 hypothetical protein [candidate division WOR-3 bacterium]